MGVFALADGRLVAATPTPGAQVPEEVLQAVREQALEFANRPLFGVGRTAATGPLIALDPLGNVVTVEVLQFLDADAFVAALAAAGRNSALNRKDLSELYPGGPQAFENDFRQFVESAPPATRRGPRLFLFYAGIAPDVNAPLAALQGVGVEARKIVVHPGERGLLVEIGEPTVPLAALSGREGAVEISPAEEVAAGQVSQQQAEVPDVAGVPATGGKLDAEAKPASDDSQPAAAPMNAETVEEAPKSLLSQLAGKRSGGPRRRRFGRRREEPSRQAPEAAPAPRAEFARSPMYDRLVQETKSAEQLLWERSGLGDIPKFDGALPDPLPRMKAVVREVGAVRVTWSSPRKGTRFTAHLANSGLIEVIGVGVYADPSKAAQAVSGMSSADGWHLWRVPDGRRLGEVA